MLGVTWEGCDLLIPTPAPQSSLRSSPCAPWGPNSAWSSRRSSWNSLGRAPSLKRRSQCGERESLLSGEGRGSGSTDEEAEDGRPGAGASPGTRATPLRRAESLDHRSTLDLRAPRPATLLPTKTHDCNGQVLALPSEFFLRIDSHKEDPAEFDDDVEDVSGGGPHVGPLPPPVVGAAFMGGPGGGKQDRLGQSASMGSSGVGFAPGSAPPPAEGWFWAGVSQPVRPPQGEGKCLPSWAPCCPGLLGATWVGI